MNNENKGSAEAGSPTEGENSNVVSKDVYDQLESKLGSQGKELGDFRTFFQDLSPLLDKLQAQPEVVEAILNGKINTALAQVVSAEKFRAEEKTVAVQFNTEVLKNNCEILFKEKFTKRYGNLMSKLTFVNP